MEELYYSQEDYQVVNSIEASIHKALWGEIIPSMRGIILKWKPGDKKAWIFFYHASEITKSIEAHYAAIMTKAYANCKDITITCDYEIIRCDPPTRVPHERFIVYLRKEPFFDPA